MDLSGGPTPTRPGPGGPVSGGGNDGPLVRRLILGFILTGVVYLIGAGYVLSSEIVAHHWFDADYFDHNWTGVGIYAGSSVLAVAGVTRFWGIVPGALVGLIPTLPLYFASQGGVGFWVIVHHETWEAYSNEFLSTVALIGTALLHAVIAMAFHRRKDPLLSKLVRWRWIITPVGFVSSVVLGVGLYWAIHVINVAIDNF